MDRAVYTKQGNSHHLKTQQKHSYNYNQKTLPMNKNINSKEQTVTKSNNQLYNQGYAQEIQNAKTIKYG